jgi:hypothetical protein
MLDTEEIVTSPEKTLVETMSCPFCSESILASAQKCKHCGEYLDENLRKERAKEVAPPAVRKWNPGVAAVCSFFIPGLGQMYKGQVLNGLFWLFIVAVGYVLYIIPGLILHLLCIFGAASGDPYDRKPVEEV